MPKPYVAHQKMFDAALPHGRHYYWKSHKLGPLTDETISVIIDQAEQITSPLSSIALFTQRRCRRARARGCNRLRQP